MAQFEFLGRLSERFAPQMQLAIPSDIDTIAGLRPWLNTQLGCDHFSQPTIRAIVNGQITAEDGAISDKDTIAFYPPVGGG